MSNIGHCGICKASDEETKLIQDSLFERLNAIMHNMKLQEEGNEDVADETLGFQRLIKIIFHKKYKNFKISTQCKHHQLRKQFSSRLKCNFKVLDILCDKISCRTAKYSFHIDVVSSQVKTFPRHFLQQKSFTPSKIEKQIEKNEKDSLEKRSQRFSSFPKNYQEKQTGKREEQIVMNSSMMVNPFLSSQVVLPSMTYPMNITWGVPFQQNPTPQTQNKTDE